MGKKGKEEVEGWRGLSRSSTKPSGLGAAKSLGDSGTLLGRSLTGQFLPSTRGCGSERCCQKCILNEERPSS